MCTGSKSTIHKVTYHQQAEDLDPGHDMAVSLAPRAGDKPVLGKGSKIISLAPCQDPKDLMTENLYIVITTIADQVQLLKLIYQWFTHFPFQMPVLEILIN